MKNTLIPLDMLFMDAKGVIRHIHPRAVPLDETPIPGAAPAGRDLREAAADIPARMADLYPGPAGQREELKAFLDELAAGLD